MGKRRKNGDTGLSTNLLLDQNEHDAENNNREKATQNLDHLSISRWREFLRYQTDAHQADYANRKLVRLLRR